MYRPCCWYIFRVAAEILGFLRALGGFALSGHREEAVLENPPPSLHHPRFERSEARPQRPDQAVPALESLLHLARSELTFLDQNRQSLPSVFAR